MTEPTEPRGSNGAEAERLSSLERGASTAEALAFFDTLPAVLVQEVIGSWRGSGVRTGHPLDGVLESFGWHGKRFESPQSVYPLVFDAEDGSLFSVNPSIIPIGVIIRRPELLRRPIAPRLFRLLTPLLRTEKPQARLRMTEYRGLVSATMIYDSLPINDVFRKVDRDTLLGLMDLRGQAQPFFFVLRRERSPDPHPNEP